MSAARKANQSAPPPTRPWHVIFSYFHKHVLLIAHPAALVTSVWLQQPPPQPPTSWLRLLRCVWLTSGLLPPNRPVGWHSLPPHYRKGRRTGGNTPPSGVGGWHLKGAPGGVRLALFASEDKRENRYNEAVRSTRHSQGGRPQRHAQDENAKRRAFPFSFFLSCLRTPRAEKRWCQILARVGIFIHTMLEEFVSH